jgi:hypothetical protein
MYLVYSHSKKVVESFKSNFVIVKKLYLVLCYSLDISNLRTASLKSCLVGIILGVVIGFRLICSLGSLTIDG